MEFKVLSVLKKYMSAEEFTAFEKATDFEKALQTDISKYITANTPKEADLIAQAKGTVQEELIKDLGIDSVTNLDELKAHIEVVGNKSSDKEKELMKVIKERDTLKASYDAEVETRTKLENEQRDLHQTNLLKSIGITDEKELKFYKWDFSQQVTEEKTFDAIVEEYAKENELKTTTKFIKDSFGGGSSKDLDISEAWQQINKRK